MKVQDLTLTVYGNPVLRRRADEVEEFGPELDALVKRMFEVMYEEEGVGLAAPQIGVSRRVMVLDVPVDEENRHVGVVINPEILETKGSQKGQEGCLSVPGLREDVTRKRWLRVRGVDQKGAPVEFEAEDLLARAVQHEVDHLNGILYVDRVSPLRRKLLGKRLKEMAEKHAREA
jgi:peptide deformylase